MYLALFLACAAPPSAPRGDDTAAPDDTDAEPEWGYAGDIGPEHWGELGEEWAACGEGTAQSPVDLAPDSFVPGGTPPEMAWTSTGLNAYNPGYYLRYEVDAGSTMTWEGRVYDLLQFHFHGRSEHTVEGQHTDVEIHFVHARRDDPTRLAVVAVFGEATEDVGFPGIFDAGGTLRFRDALALTPSHEPTALGASVDLGTTFAMATGAEMAHYSGSLTTPPCTEGVDFFLVSRVVPLLPEDVAAFHAVFDDNYRPVQPLNGRVLTELTRLE